MEMSFVGGWAGQDRVYKERQLSRYKRFLDRWVLAASTGARIRP